MNTILVALLGAMALLTAQALAAPPAPDVASPGRPFVRTVSASADFDRDCVTYYRQNNDPEVSARAAPGFCACLAEEYAARGLRKDALDFFARTYSDDLTTFIDDYSSGEAWMEASFAVEPICKAASRPETGLVYPRAAGSWGGIVRSGPGQQYQRLGSLREGERVTLLENTGVMENGYPWLRISYREGREGYKWGGILCSLGEASPDVFEVCP